jgi:hypothetical protein
MDDDEKQAFDIARNAIMDSGAIRAMSPYDLMEYTWLAAKEYYEQKGLYP